MSLCLLKNKSSTITGGFCRMALLVHSMFANIDRNCNRGISLFQVGHFMAYSKDHQSLMNLLTLALLIY